MQTAVLLFVAALMGCATTPKSRYRAFTKVKMGMTKTTVVETVGGPDHAVRLNGKIRWIYVFYNDIENPEQQELQFDDGKVSYIGPVTKPPVSAEEQDKINQAENDKEDERLQKIEDENSKRLGRVHLNSSTRRDANLEESLYGTEPDVQRGKLAPTFTPIE